MQKIPTMFTRLHDGKIVNEIAPGCRWVFSGEGFATEKLDGTNVRLTVRANEIIRVEKRRNPTAQQRQKFAQRGVRVIEPWYVDANPDEPADKHIFAAVEGTDVSGIEDGEYCAEAIGPKLQGNPLELPSARCFMFSVQLILTGIIYPNVPRDFNSLREWFEIADSIYSPGHKPEGIVFYNSDGRLAKIKAKDFAALAESRASTGVKNTTIDQRGKS